MKLEQGDRLWFFCPHCGEEQTASVPTKGFHWTHACGRCRRSVEVGWVCLSGLEPYLEVRAKVKE
jgi:transcription elongation factor Elf1